MKDSQKNFNTLSANSERNKKIERGAKDFAVRFEEVMRELANG